MSSASIPAVTFSSLQICRPAATHETKQSIAPVRELPMTAVKKSDRTKEPFIPSPIATHSQLQQ
jgi:hypothetical protein